MTDEPKDRRVQYMVPGGMPAEATPTCGLQLPQMTYDRYGRANYDAFIAEAEQFCRAARSATSMFDASTRMALKAAEFLEATFKVGEVNRERQKYRLGQDVELAEVRHRIEALRRGHESGRSRARTGKTGASPELNEEHIRLKQRAADKAEAEKMLKKEFGSRSFDELSKDEQRRWLEIESSPERAEAKRSKNALESYLKAPEEQ